MYFIHNTFKNVSFHFLTKQYLHTNSIFTNFVFVIIQFPFVGGQLLNIAKMAYHNKSNIIKIF